MRENRPYGSEGGGSLTNAILLPLSRLAQGARKSTTGRTCCRLQGSLRSQKHHEVYEALSFQLYVARSWPDLETRSRAARPGSSLPRISFPLALSLKETSCAVADSDVRT